jgi:hypothetical protein
MAGAEASMAKSKGNTNTLYVGSTNVFGSATKVLNKKIGSVDGPKQITDDVTTDDSTGPEHDTIYPVIIESIEVEVLVDPADASYIFLNARSKDGVKCFVFWRPEGDVSTRDQFLFSGDGAREAEARQRQVVAPDLHPEGQRRSDAVCGPVTRRKQCPTACRFGSASRPESFASA